MSITEDEVMVHVPYVHCIQEIRPIYNWHEWLVLRRQVAGNFHLVGGLLDVGFSVSLEKVQYREDEYDKIDRFVHYFGEADGWADSRLLRLPEDKKGGYQMGFDSNGNLIKKTPDELRQQLAHKAFNMLCLNFFEFGVKGPDHNKFISSWEQALLSERLFPVIQNFFRFEKVSCSYGSIAIHNLPRRNNLPYQNEQIVVDFLVDLARLLWRFQEPDVFCGFFDDNKRAEIAKSSVEMHVRVDAAKPWMIEILNYLDKLDLLQDLILELDEACLAKLKEIALRSQLDSYNCPVAESRPVVTIDEACYAGSKAAWLLREHELIVRENERLATILEAKRRIAETEREIEVLTYVK